MIITNNKDIHLCLDNDESSVSSQSSVPTQWAPRPSSQPPSDQARPNNTIANSQIVPAAVLYQQGPVASRPQAPNVDTKREQVHGVATDPGNRIPVPPLSVLSPRTPPPRKESDVKIGQGTCTASAQQGGDAAATLEEPSLGENPIHLNDIRVRHMKEKTVSEVFSMAMQTLSELDYYEATEELLPRSFDAVLPQPCMTATHNTNGFFPGNDYATNGNASQSPFLGTAPTILQPEMQFSNSNKYQISPRPQRNFLMTMPPPPVATMGCPQIRLDMAHGIAQVPHRLSQLHQGGGGGVKIPIVSLAKNHAVSIVRQSTIQRKGNCEDISLDKILSDLQKSASSKCATGQGHTDDNQEKVDLSCVVCKTSYNVSNITVSD